MPQGIYGQQPSRLNQPMASAAYSTDPWSQGNPSNQSAFGDTNWGGIASGAGVLGSGLAALAAAERNRQLMSTFAQPLPYQQESGDSIMDITKLINEYRNAQAPLGTLNLARNQSRQASAMRGLKGPLSASVEVEAVNNANSLYDQWRRQALLQAIAAREQLIQRQQEQFMASGAKKAAALKAMMDADYAAGAGIGKGIGSIIGSFWGPMGTSLLGEAGGAIGGGVSGAGNQHNYDTFRTSWGAK